MLKTLLSLRLTALSSRRTRQEAKRLLSAYQIPTTSPFFRSKEAAWSESQVSRAVCSRHSARTISTSSSSPRHLQFTQCASLCLRRMPKRQRRLLTDALHMRFRSASSTRSRWRRAIRSSASWATTFSTRQVLQAECLQLSDVTAFRYELQLRDHLRETYL